MKARRCEAAELLQRVLGIQEPAFGPNHPDVAQTLNNLAVVYRSLAKPDFALASSRKATAAVLAHAATEDKGSEKTVSAGGLVEQRADYFVLHVAKLAGAGRGFFEIAQWAVQSSVGAAVQQMALRFSSGDSAVAKLVRENQDLAATWRGQDKALFAALSKPEKQQAPAETGRLRKQIAETEQKLAALVRVKSNILLRAQKRMPKPIKGFAPASVRAEKRKAFETWHRRQNRDCLPFYEPGRIAIAPKDKGFFWRTFKLLRYEQMERQRGERTRRHDQKMLLILDERVSGAEEA